MDTKICNYCKIEKNIDCYEKIGNKKQYTRNICKECKKMLGRISWEKYYSNNKKEINNRALKYQNKRKETDECYKMKVRLRKMINNSFRRKKYKKNSNNEKIIGCEWEFFINYLLNTFKNNYGYDWDGKEKISIDHIIPLAIAKTEEEVIKLCHYTNLQLLKAKDNLDKKDKLDWELKI